MSSGNRPDSGRGRSLARKSVEPQQILFPRVKLELGILVMLLFCLWLVVAIAGLSHFHGLLVLAAGSSLAALWLVWRIRRTLRRAEADAGRKGSEDEP